LTSDYQTMIKNGFTMYYRFFPKPHMFVWYRGNPLQDLIKQPTYVIKSKEPMKSEFRYDDSVIQVSNSVFDTIEILCAEGKHCVAAMLGSHLYESFTKSDEEFKATGKHVLIVPLWVSVLKLVQAWEKRHPKTKVHVGTPLYFLSVGYFLTHNNDPAFIYLIKSIDGDIELSEHCPEFNYPEKEPAYLTVCLVDDPDNYMHDFIVLPLRSQLQDAISEYNELFGKESRLSDIHEFDSKFLQKRDTQTVRIELIKQLFVLELVKLLQLRNIELDINSKFFRMLLLNRLFSLALVVDKLLYVNYSSDKDNGDKEPQMFECVISYAKAHGIERKKIDDLNYNRYDPEEALEFLLEKRSQEKCDVLSRELFPILIAHAIRNTSGHKIHAVEVLYSKFNEILQSLVEAVFIIVGQMQDSK
jgi:hypothetical protein